MQPITGSITHWQNIGGVFFLKKYKLIVKYLKLQVIKKNYQIIEIIEIIAVILGLMEKNTVELMNCFLLKEVK